MICSAQCCCMYNKKEKSTIFYNLKYYCTKTVFNSFSFQKASQYRKRYEIVDILLRILQCYPNDRANIYIDGHTRPS